MASLSQYPIEEELPAKAGYYAYFSGKYFVKTTARSARKAGASVFVADSDDAADPFNAPLQETARRLATLGKTAGWAESAAYEHEGATFYVQPRYSASLFDWVSLKRQLAPKDIERLVLAILNGLEALYSSDNNAHANLKLTNVLVKQTSAEPLFLLSDPAPAAQAAKQTRQEADYRALGLVLLQIVRRSEWHEPMPDSAPDSDDWAKTFKSAGRKWQDFCTQLLNPRSDFKNASIDDIRAALKKLKSGPPVMLMATGAVVLLAAAAGAFIFMQTEEEAAIITDNGERPVVEAADIETVWGEFCSAFSDRWGPFKRTVQAQQRNRASWERKLQPLHEAIIARFGEKALSLETPQVVSGKRGTFESLLNLPQDELKDRRREITAASQQVEELNALLGSWDEIEETRKRQQWFEREGFTRAAERMGTLLERITAPANDNLYRDLLEMLELQASAESMVETFGSLEPLFERMEGTGVAPLKAFRKYCINRVDTESAESYDRATAMCRNLEGEGLTIYQRFQKNIGTIDKQLWLAESSLAKKSSGLEKEDYQLLGIELLDYQLLADGFADPYLTRWEKQIDNTRKKAAEIESFPGAPALTTERARIDNVAAQVEEWRDTPRIRKNRNKLEGLAGEIDAALIDARKPVDVKYAVVMDVPLEKLLSDLATRETRFRSPSVQNTWDSLRNSFITAFKGSGSGKDKFFELQQRVDAMTGFMVEFDGELARRLTRTIAVAAVDLTEPFEALRDSLKEKAISEQMTGDVRTRLASVPASEEFPGLQERWVIDTLRNAQTRYEEEIARADALANGITQLSEQAGSPDFSMENLVGVLEHPMYASVSNYDSVRDLMDPYREAVDLRNATDPRRLIRALRDPEQRPVLALIAWLQLNEVLAAGGTLGTHWDDVITLRENLKGKFFGKLADRYESANRIIWQAYVLRPQDPELLNNLFVEMRGFGVADAALNGDLKWTHDLWQHFGTLRKKETARDFSFEQATSLQSELITTVGNRQSATASNVLTELKGLTLKDDPGGGGAASGHPLGKKGWTVVSEDDTRAVFSWNNFQIAFRKFELDNGKVFFISEEEMALALLKAWFDDQGLWTSAADWCSLEMQEYLTTGAEGTALYPGPRSWLPEQGGLTSGIRLLGGREWVFSVDYYTHGRFLTQYKPEDANALPVQFINPLWARKAAESLGLTLPTPQMWEKMTAGTLAPPGNANFWDRSAIDFSVAALERMDSSAILDSPTQDLDNILLGVLGSGYYNNASLQAYAPVNDGFLWFAPVNADIGTIKGMKHLAGNVAEYLYNPETQEYFIAGGSALSSFVRNWRELRPVQPTIAFGDAGLRLAYLAPYTPPGVQLSRALARAWEITAAGEKSAG